MSAPTDQDPAAAPEPTLEQLRAQARGLRLFAVTMEPAARWGETPPAERQTILREHLLWQQARERDGVLVLAGPLDPERTPGLGLAVIRADDRASAEALMASEPFAQAGLRTNAVAPWIVNEGSITLTVRLFDDRGVLH